VRRAGTRRGYFDIRDDALRDGRSAKWNGFSPSNPSPVRLARRRPGRAGESRRVGGLPERASRPREALDPGARSCRGGSGAHGVADLSRFRCAPSCVSPVSAAAIAPKWLAQTNRALGDRPVFAQIIDAPTRFHRSCHDPAQGMAPPPRNRPEARLKKKALELTASSSLGVSSEAPAARTMSGWPTHEPPGAARLACRRQIGARQVLVDLGEPRQIGRAILDDEHVDRLPAARDHAMRPGRGHTSRRRRRFEHACR
jgi:hypothetical protein